MVATLEVLSLATVVSSLELATSLATKLPGDPLIMHHILSFLTGCLSAAAPLIVNDKVAAVYVSFLDRGKSQSRLNAELELYVNLAAPKVHAWVMTKVTEVD